MENFKIFTVENEKYPVFIVVLFCHSKVNQRQHIVERLQEMNYEGYVLIDNLMQTGVEGLRFYYTYFKNDFIDEGYPIMLSKDSIYRKIACDYLRENKIPEGSNLSQKKIDAIMSGEII